MARALAPLKAFYSAFEQSRAVVALFDGDQRLLYLNPAGVGWLGQDPATLIGEKVPYTSWDGVASPLAGLSPPPDAFAGKYCLGSIVAPPTDGTEASLPALFVPLASGEEGLAVLMIAGDEAWLNQLADQANGGEHAWHAALQSLQSRLPSEFRGEYLLGKSPRMHRLREQLQWAGSHAANTVIVSKPGCGEDALAQSIVDARTMPPGNVLSIDCALHDAETLTAALRGYSFRQEQSLLWLKQVHSLMPSAQEKLLAWLRGASKTSVLTTSSQPLSQLVRKQGFLPALAAELSIFTIAVPSLKSRAEDIPLLAQWCVERHNLERSDTDGDRGLNGVAPEALDRLAAYSWPGNVDECVAMIRAACQRAKGLWLTVADLPERLQTTWDNWAHPRREPEPVQLDALLAEVETEVLRRAMKQARGNKSKAAQLLGISRPRLLRRLVQLGLASPAEEKIDFQPLDDSEVTGGGT